MAVTQTDWNNAARYASNLSELEATLGRLGEAADDGRSAIGFADQSRDALHRISKRSTAADTLHQSGERAEAWACSTPCRVSSMAT